MKKGILLLVIFVFITKGYCQLETQNLKNYTILKEGLIELYGLEWYESFNNHKGWFYIKICVDSLGQIIEIEDLKAGNAISKKELCGFAKYLKKNKRFIVYSPDPHLSKIEYLSQNNNKIIYPFRFSPLLFESKQNKNK